MVEPPPYVRKPLRHCRRLAHVAQAAPVSFRCCNELCGQGQEVVGQEASAPAPYSKEATKAPAKEPTGPIWEKKPKNFAIGGDIQSSREPGPLCQVAQVRAHPAPAQGALPAFEGAALDQPVHQHARQEPFAQPLQAAAQVPPEDKAAKKERIARGCVGQGRRRGREKSKKPLYVKYGINHITKLCEDKKAQLVCIAHDVDPVEVRRPHARLL